MWNIKFIQWEDMLRGQTRGQEYMTQCFVFIYPVFSKTWIPKHKHKYMDILKAVESVQYNAVLTLASVVQPTLFNLINLVCHCTWDHCHWSCWCFRSQQKQRSLVTEQLFIRPAIKQFSKLIRFSVKFFSVAKCDENYNLKIEIRDEIRPIHLVRFGLISSLICYFCLYTGIEMITSTDVSGQRVSCAFGRGAGLILWIQRMWGIWWDEGFNMWSLIQTHNQYISDVRVTTGYFISKWKEEDTTRCVQQHVNSLRLSQVQWGVDLVFEGLWCCFWHHHGHLVTSRRQ